ncbi:MAG: galactose-1-phosphate uridylyltransferase [Candidatus Omnitrophica bacterium]|nr:galactose-1-phosphate uridylyltransferase [Candidatus Omnitrophota bacterium]
MSELRQNLATREWVIIATERASKPMDFANPAAKAPVAEREANCPFCPVHEAITGPELFAVRPEGGRPDTPSWRLRVVPNKFPALTPSPTCAILPQRLKEGPYLRMDGCGHHEVIVEHPRHDQTLAGMTVEEVRLILESYWHRHHQLASDCNNHLMTIFRNYGEKAGASLRHPHSQLITTGIVPLHIRTRLYEAQRYFDDVGTCAYCDILRHEMKSKERLILENDGYAVFAPYASGTPYEMWVMPKRHRASFGDLPQEELGAWAEALQGALARLAKLLNDPDYNYVLQTSPYPLAAVPFYHWHLVIIPHLKTKRAGFEIGSGISINIVSPEAAARALRETL